MAQGPLAVRFGSWTLDDPQAGAVGTASVELENAGTIRWGDGILLSYHWLDDRGNPIVWDGIRTPVPPLEPGERAVVEARVRAPIPPGRYRFALDLVAEHRAWFAELGDDPAPDVEVKVEPRSTSSHVEAPGWIEPAPDYVERVTEAHAEGYAVVAGAIDWGRRTPRELAAYRPGGGRVPGFTHALLCPSVVDGVELERLPDVAGLPAFAAPADEPWVYDGRIVLRASTARPRSGRPRG